MELTDTATKKTVRCLEKTGEPLSGSSFPLRKWPSRLLSENMKDALLIMVGDSCGNEMGLKWSPGCYVPDRRPK